MKFTPQFTCTAPNGKCIYTTQLNECISTDTGDEDLPRICPHLLMKKPLPQKIELKEKKQNMTYCQRKHKHYKHPKPNATQTPQQRKTKYQFIKALTHNTKLAQIGRDYRENKMFDLIRYYLMRHST